jgi:hypothetical protein
MTEEEATVVSSDLAQLRSNLSLAEKKLDVLRALLRSVQINAVVPDELMADIEHAIGPVTPASQKDG